MRTSLDRPVSRLAWLWIAGMLLVWGAAGCASTRDRDSDIPWNAPQSWEGAPIIPGFQSSQ